ncbi:FHA domain-containing protein [Actinoplanes sp. NPDC023936]|uniref:FHA domain-containing protein n=1 Tax=Actinoplanes sp. NPDC023936 TaxID=3154910 RepID=UPI0033F2CA7E
MTSYTCPKGHQSAESDFCDTCGVKITGAEPAAVPVAGPAATPGAEIAETCPHCGAPRGGSARFCEDCGYDHDTGRLPALDATPPAAWTATIFADPVYFDANEVDGVTFPQDAPAQTVTLPAPQVRIGRRSSSHGTAPDLDLTGDPGVSHNHALLTLTIDGQWLVSDLGSTNGTYLNAEDTPLTAGQSRTLKDGDQVHVGIWTTITLHAPS